MSDTVKIKERFLVTVKLHTERPCVFKVVGPDGTTQFKKVHELRQFAEPWRQGKKQWQAMARMNREGRWSIVELVLPAGFEPATS